MQKVNMYKAFIRLDPLQSVPSLFATVCRVFLIKKPHSIPSANEPVDPSTGTWQQFIGSKVHRRERLRADLGSLTRSTMDSVNPRAKTGRLRAAPLKTKIP